MERIVKVIGFSGSLRKDSFNSALLRVAAELMPEGSVLELVEWGHLPLYNSDLEVGGQPEAVLQLRAQVAAGDALLFATPEYNYSIPGGLKNAIDWLSRGKGQPFDNKPTAIMGASMGALGSARAQYHLRQVGVYLNMHFVNKPEVMIGAAHTKFDAEGKLTDDVAKKLIAQLLSNLVDAVRAQKG